MNREPSPDRRLEDALDDFVSWAVAENACGADAGLPPLDDDRPSLGDFDLLRQLGRGGMSIVYEATQRSVPGRRVAVKVLRAVSRSEASNERFRREVTAIGSLDHPGIVPVIAADVDSGTPYYAMKYVRGISLAEVIAELKRYDLPPRNATRVGQIVAHRLDHTAENSARTDTSSTNGSDSDGRLDGSYTRWAARFTLDVADALAHAHERGVIHRDMKPANVLVTPRGRAVLIDFGLAGSDAFETLTSAGHFMGTLAYAPPEQARGEPVDARADVYSLGATLYELLSLDKPFTAASERELSLRIQRGEPAALPRSVPAPLATICTKAMATNATRRYSTAAELAADLRRFLSGDPVLARPPGVVARAACSIRRHPRLTLGVIALAISATVIVSTLQTRGRARREVVAAERLLAQATALEGPLEAAWHDADETPGSPEAEARRERIASETGRLLALTAESRDGFDRALRISPGLARAILGVQRANRLRERWTEGNAGRLVANALRMIEGDPMNGEQLAAAERLLLRARDASPDAVIVRHARATLAAARLALALRDNSDLLAPDHVAALDDAIRRHDVEGRFGSLLIRSNRISITPTPAETVIRIARPGAPRRPIHQSRGPLRDLELPEGRYVARLSAPHRATVLLPFVVRRPAAFASKARPQAADLHEHEVRLREHSDVPDGWVHIPAGWSLLGDDPPTWHHVPYDYAIRRTEVTFAEWLDFLNAPERTRLHDEVEWEFLARRPGEEARIVKSSSGRYVLAPHVRPSRPVSIIPRRAAGVFLNWHATVGPEPDRCWLGLPTEREWERAARGVGGASSATARAGDDVSPFGVEGMAGGVAEMTRSAFDPSSPSSRDVLTVRGGSWLTSSGEPLGTRRQDHNVSQLDVGFRPARYFADAHGADRFAVTAPFHDAFDGPTIGRAWRAMFGTVSHPQDPFPGESVAVRDGTLVVRAGTGNGSNAAYAVLGVRDLGSQFRIRATLRVERANDADGRASVLTLRSSLGPAPSERTDLVMHPDGRMVLNHRRGADRTSASVATGLRYGSTIGIDLRSDASSVELRVHPVGGTPPERPTLRVVRDAREPPSFVVVRAANYVGATVRIFDLAIDRL